MDYRLINKSVKWFRRFFGYLNSLINIFHMLKMWLGPQCWEISLLSVVAGMFIVFLIGFGISSIIRGRLLVKCGYFDFSCGNEFHLRNLTYYVGTIWTFHPEYSGYPIWKFDLYFYGKKGYFILKHQLLFRFPNLGMNGDHQDVHT